MKRALVALLSATLLSAVVAVSAIAVERLAMGTCATTKDMNTLKTVPYAVFRRHPVGEGLRVPAIRRHRCSGTP